MYFLENNSIQIGAIDQSKKLSVYLETLDGLVFEGKAMVAKLDASADCISPDVYSVPIRQRWDLELSGLGEFTLSKGIDMAQRIAARFLPAEWVCKFCERANDSHMQQCQSCGWYRGIIADVVQEMGIWRPK